MKRPCCVLLSAMLAVLFILSLTSANASAAGAQLCSLNQTPCSAAYPAGTKVELKLATGTKLKKIASGGFFWDECAGFSMSGTTSTAGGATTPVEVPLSTLSFSTCGSCTTSVVKPGRLVIENIPGTMNAKVRWKEFEFKELCGFPEPCVVKSEVPQRIFLKGGAEAEIRLENATFTSTACGTEEWSSSSKVTAPKPLYISGATSESFFGGGVLCKGVSKPCSLKYGSGTPLSAKLKAGVTSTLEAGFANIKCEESSMTGEVQDPGSSIEPVVGVWSSWTFGGCNCSVTVPSAGNFGTDWTSENNGAVTLSGLETKVDCGGKECTFGGAVKGITLTGGNPAVIKITAVPIPKKTGIAECSSSSKWTAEYEVTAPKPLYVTES
jgi:hypothetical protein